MEADRSALQSVSSPDQINHGQAAQKLEIARTPKVKQSSLGGLTFNSYLTNLHGLRSRKRFEKDGSIWLSIKRGK